MGIKLNHDLVTEANDALSDAILCFDLDLPRGVSLQHQVRPVLVYVVLEEQVGRHFPLANILYYLLLRE